MTQRVLHKGRQSSTIVTFLLRTEILACGYFQIQRAAQNFVSHELFEKLSEPIQWMTKPTSSPKKTFGTASSLQKRS